MRKEYFTFGIHNQSSPFIRGHCNTGSQWFVQTQYHRSRSLQFLAIGHYIAIK